LLVSVFPCLVLVWFFLWLPQEELTLLFLLHRENGDKLQQERGILLLLQLRRLLHLFIGVAL